MKEPFKPHSFRVSLFLEMDEVLRPQRLDSRWPLDTTCQWAPHGMGYGNESNRFQVSFITLINFFSLG